MPRPAPQKYRPLAEYLAAQPAGVDRLTLSVGEIEAILGAPLPPLALTRTWWLDRGNRAGRHARVWLAAGWYVAARDLRTPPGTVTFARQSSVGP